MFSRLAGSLSKSVALAVREACALAGRERAFLAGEVAKFSGLVPLLVLAGSRQPLSDLERDALRAHLRRASVLSPYLAVSLLPGAFVLLPLVVWWRDRRRLRSPRAASCRAGKPAA